VMVAVHMFVHEEPGRALAIAREPLGRYISSLVDAASDWGSATSADYPGYDKIIMKLKNDSVETQVAEGSAWIGTPDEVIAQIKRFVEQSGDFDIASLQVNFNDMPLETASASMRLFAEKVAPSFASQPAGV
jgi:alkanesulfonate monooxygenase SsuD/methylene tetrahydromethanopterin reductase-like flavin-dependent oxidoreductase (luciferase family)